MPLSTPISIKRVLVPLALATIALVAPAGALGASCPKQTTTKAFAKYGDTADYTVAPGGSFEAGVYGWSLLNSRTVPGNETGGILPGTRSLALGTGFVSGPTIVTTPEFCVGTEHPYFRYMLKANGAVGLLATFISYRDARGSLIQQQVRSNISTNLLPGKWKPSDLNPLSVNLPIKDGEITKVRLVFITPASFNGAGYQIDNVMIDPYRRG